MKSNAAADEYPSLMHRHYCLLLSLKIQQKKLGQMQKLFWVY